MIHLDRKHFDDKCEEIIADIEDKKIRSSAWLWIACGGIVGFAMSCIRLHNKIVTPIMAGTKKEDTLGEFNSKWNSKNNKGFRGKKNG